MNKTKKILISLLITLVIGFVAFYVTLPALNLQSQEFWVFLLSLIIIFGVSCLLLSLKDGKGENKSFYNAKKGHFNFEFKKNSSTLTKVWIAVACVPVLVLVIGNLLSSTFFNAHDYANVITVQEAVFEEDMQENDTVTNIALMDSTSATAIGNRTLGALSEVVSQYEVSYSYSQINYKGAPKKLANLEYVDIFKWFNNRERGIPGFVMVDPVNFTAEYVQFAKPLKYVESAYLNEDLMRELRFQYPTKIFDNVTFEIDEQGNPFYIVSCSKPRVGLFGAYDISEVIIFDPCTGDSSIYAVADTPSWIDTVYTGYLAAEKYDWHGMYSNGFWNSVIGNKDCKVTTDDFGYIMIGDDVWYFTGVTSIVSDESNIGFIISNARTGEYKFYPVIGAEEYSAMAAAEGEVQEKRYTASFPSLINVSGEATYIMVFKDDAGLVKLVALVNVEQYGLVATGNNQEEAKKAYIELLKSEGLITAPVPEPTPEVENKSTTVTVDKTMMAVVGGESVVYIVADDGVVYKQKLSADESMIFIEAGDKIKIEFTDTDIENIKQIVSWNVTD